MSDDRELGLDTLVAVGTELGIDLDTELLKACFEVQKKYQFSHDRTLSTLAMERLIEGYVEKTSIKVTKKGA